MTIVEKILADHSDRNEVSPGDLIKVNVDLALANDITAPLAIGVFEDMGTGKVFDPEKVALVADHFVPNKDIPSAEQARMMKDFAVRYGVKHYYELGDGGIEHVILPENGIVIPGDLVIGADSHTCTYGALGAFSSGVGSTDIAVIMATGKTWLKVPPTIKLNYNGTLMEWVGGKDLILFTIGKLGVEGAIYKALEFSGEAIRTLPMDHRLTMANMAVEAGAKAGIVEPDDITRAYVNGRTSREPKFFQGDPDAAYEAVIDISVDRLEPQVAFPSSPANVKPVSEAGDVAIDQAFIGSCTNGRMDDLRQAADVLKGRKAAKGTRLIVMPGSSHIYRKAMKEGLLETFLDAGAVIGPPCCGPCLGGHMGVLAEGERAVSTSNRNFIGRMGHPKSEVYLANPAVAAASSVMGKIGSPEDL